MEANMSERDREILRRLAVRRREIAENPENKARQDAWYRHDAGTGGRPMVLAEVGGVINEVMPAARVCECADEWARSVEMRLRVDLYQFDTLKDDHVVEPEFDVFWKVTPGTYGVESVQHRPADTGGRMGARRWDPPIRDLDADFGKLRRRVRSVDRAGTLAEKERAEKVFGDILPVRVKGSFFWSLGMTNVAIDLIGLEQLMLAMYDNPSGLHRLMAFLRDDYLAYTEWLEKEGLFTLNNGNDYLGSGSIGYSRSLPQQDRRPGMPVLSKDLWVLLESQETVGVGPDLFEEFIFPCQAAIARRYGKIYYGCCEPVHSRWDVLKKISNLERVSISPWADEAFMAEALGERYVYSRKPAPSLISTGIFDEAAVRADIRRTLDIAKDCRVELIMKDVHTLNNEPERLPRWVAVAREEIGRARGG